jgi:hypothetical protein
MAPEQPARYYLCSNLIQQAARLLLSGWGEDEPRIKPALV